MTRADWYDFARFLVCIDLVAAGLYWLARVAGV